MKTEAVVKLVGQKVKVYFGERDQRFPCIGKFVMLPDGKELQRKGMVRFVNDKYSSIWNDDAPCVAYAKIFKTEDFTQIKIV